MVKKYCKNIGVKLMFTTFKLKDSFSCKDSLSSFSHTSKVIYKFVCTNCSVSYIGETERNLSTRIKEHYKDKNSHVFKHVNASLKCKNTCNDNCFSILDCASTKFQLRIKEGLYLYKVRTTGPKQTIIYIVTKSAFCLIITQYTGLLSRQFQHHIAIMYYFVMFSLDNCSFILLLRNNAIFYHI